MANIDWLKKLGWDEEQLEDLRLAGYAYIRQGKYDIALPFYEALCVLEPDEAYNHQTLGAIYLQMNNPKRALFFFEKALKVDADHGPTLINVTKALFMIGKKDEGLKLANILANEQDPVIANTAKALILAYG